MKIRALPANVTEGLIAFLAPYVKEKLTGDDVVSAIRAFKKDKAPLSPKNDTALTVRKAAECLSCSSRQVWRLISAGKIKTFKLGARSKRIPASEIEKFFEINI